MQANSMWNGYYLLEEIGRGGMGIVWKAQQQNLSRLVAIKVIITGEISNRQRQRFVKEAQINAQISHPNIVQCYHADLYNQFPFIVMQYIEGISLRKYIKETPCSNKKIIEIIKNVAYALDYAHQKGIIHRDIKPENILLAAGEQPYVVDFGLARSTQIRDRSITRTGEILGTPRYMSPEQAEGLKRNIDARSDIYSLGSTLYEATTGSPPVKGERALEILHNLIQEPVTPPKILNPDISDSLQAVILKAMAYDKDNRYVSAQDFAEDLDRILKNESVLAPAHNKILFAVQHWRRSLPLKTLLAVFMVMVLGIGAWLLPNTPTIVVKKSSSQRKNELIKQIENREQQQQWIEFLLALEELYALERKNPQTIEWLGNKALKSGNYSKAEKYIHQAIKLRPQSLVLQKKMAEALLGQKKYRQAIQKYQFIVAKTSRMSSSDRMETLIGFAAAYYQQRDYANARSTLEKFNRSAIEELAGPIRVQLIFLKAIVDWEILQKRLNRWDWLYRKSETTTLKHQLTQIREHLLQGMALLKTLPPHNKQYPFFACHGKLIMRCIDSLNGEMRGKNSISLEFNSTIPIAMEILLRKVAIRTLIRAQKWHKANALCQQSQQKFPWISHFYHLWILVRHHFGDNLGHMMRMIKLDAWNPLLMKDILEDLFSRYTQQEFYDFYRILYYCIDRPPMNIEQLALAEYRYQLQANYNQTDVKPAKAPLTPEILHHFLHTSLPEARRYIAENIIQYHYKNPVYIKWRKNLRKQKLAPQQRQALKKLDGIRDSRQHKKQRQEIESILLRYSFAYHKFYAMQVRKHQKAEVLLPEIIRDSQAPPMMRYLAARMMVAVAKYDIFQTLQSMRDEAYPINILVAAAIHRNNIAIKVANIPWPNMRRQWRTLSSQDKFYRILQALSTELTTEQLIDNIKHTPLFWYALHNTRKLTNIRIQKKLLQTIGNNIKNIFEPNVRICAFRTFCQLLTHTRKNIMYSSPQHVKLLAELLLQESNPRVQAAMVQGLGVELRPFIKQLRLQSQIVKGNNYKRKAISQSIKQLQNIQKYLLQLLPQANEFLQYWVVMTATFLDQDNEIWKFIHDPKYPFLLRRLASMIAWVYGGKQQRWKIFNYHFSNLTSDKLKTTDVRQQKFVRDSLLIQTYYNFSITINLRDWINSKNTFMQSIAVTGLMWIGSLPDVKRLRPHLHSNHIDVQRATAASIARILSYHPVKKMRAIHKILKLQPQNIRKAAAFGYYENIRYKVYDKWKNAIALYKNYSNYIREFRRQLVNKQLPPQKCLNYLKYARELFPHSRYYYETALVCAHMEKFTQACHYLNRALQSLSKKALSWDLFTMEARCLLLKSEIFYHQRKWPKALQYAKQALKDSPLDFQIHQHLQQIHKAMGHSSQAQRSEWEAYLCAPLRLPTPRATR